MPQAAAQRGPAAGRTPQIPGEPPPTPDRLVTAHIVDLRRFARALLRGDREGADDLLQDSLERALSHWQTRRVDGNLRGWLHAILYHRFLTDRERRKRRGPHVGFGELAERDLPIIRGGQEGALGRRDLERAIAALPHPLRRALFLIAIEGLSYRQAACALCVPVGTVLSRVSRAREQVRRSLEGDTIPMRQRPRAGVHRRLSRRDPSSVVRDHEDGVVEGETAGVL